MRLLAIDPGPAVSGAVVLDTAVDPPAVLEVFPEIDTADLCARCLLVVGQNKPDDLAIEMVSSYGMPVGREVFETVLWIGRIGQAFSWGRTTLVYRKEVKLHLCNSLRAKASNVRRAILDLYPRTGGGKTPQVGTKKQPGPLYGVSKHAWAALAVGITWAQDESIRARCGL